MARLKARLHPCVPADFVKVIHDFDERRRLVVNAV